MKRLKFLTVGLIVTCLLLMVACSSGGSGGSSSNGDSKGNSKNEKFKINIAMFSGPQMDEFYKSVKEDFKKEYPNVTVNVNIIPHDNYYTKIQTSLSGGKGPDLYFMNGPNFPKFASLGLIENLNSYIEKDNFDTSVFPKGVTDLYQYEGDYYGIPKSIDPIVFYYNKAMFDKAGIDYPDSSWTWDDIEKYGKKLTNKSENVYGYIFDVPPREQASLYPLIKQAGGHVINEDKSKSGFGTSETTKAMAFLNELVKEGIAPPPSMALQTFARQLFASGRAAMFPGGSYDFKVVREGLGDDKVGIAPLPHQKEKGYLAHGTAYVMNSNSEHKQASWDLMKILVGVKSQKILAKNGSNFPSNKGAVDTFIQAFPDINMKAFKSQLNSTEPYPVTVETKIWQEEMEKQWTKTLQGDISAEEASQNIEKAMNAALTKEK